MTLLAPNVLCASALAERHHSGPAREGGLPGRQSKLVQLPSAGAPTLSKRDLSRLSVPDHPTSQSRSAAWTRQFTQQRFGCEAIPVGSCGAQMGRRSLSSRAVVEADLGHRR